MSRKQIFYQNRINYLKLTKQQIFFQKGQLIIKKDDKYCGYVVLEKPIKYKQSNETLNKIEIYGVYSMNGALNKCIVGVQIQPHNLKFLDFSSSEKQEEEQSNSSDYETVSESEISVGESESESEDEFPEFIQQKKKQHKIEGKIMIIFENPYLTKQIIGKIKQNNFYPVDEQLPVMKCLNLQEFFSSNERNEKSFYFGKIFSKNKGYLNPRIELIEQFVVEGNNNNKQVELETNAIIYDLDIPMEEYSQKDVEYLKALPKIENEIVNRSDLSKEIVFTIDPVTARDLDDSLSIKQLDQDNYEVSVHISDVSYYLASNTNLDQKAQIKTTSFYLPHKVLPMLPEELSSNLCSLNPGEYKLTITCSFVIDLEGQVKEDQVKIFKSAIISRAKMSYEMAQEIIEGNDSWQQWATNPRLKVSGEQGTIIIY